MFESSIYFGFVMGMVRNVVFLLGLMLFSGCLKDKTVPDNAFIQLRWTKGYTDDTFQKALLGLAWTYSHLGAKNTDRLYDMPVEESTITVDVRKLGLTDHAVNKLTQLHAVLNMSEEFSVHGSIEMGRYISLVIGAAEHYYALTEMPASLGALLSQYTLAPSVGFVDNSSISVKHRVVRFSAQDGLNQLFITEERDVETGDILEYETADLMENGQLRFGIFNEDGQRQAAADALNSEAGKPAKCMWCHESGIQPLFLAQSDIEGYLTYLELKDTLLAFRSAHAAKRNALLTGVDFTQPQDHAFMELLYISFMEPSAARLSREWNLSLSNVQERLAGLPAHVNEEFPFLGELYDRSSVDPLAPYQSVTVSGSIREKSEVEVNHL